MCVRVAAQFCERSLSGAVGCEVVLVAVCWRLRAGESSAVVSFLWAVWTQTKPQRECVWWYWLVLKVVASSQSSAPLLERGQPDDVSGLGIFLRERCGDRREGREDTVYNGHRNPVLMCCLMSVSSPVPCAHLSTYSKPQTKLLWKKNFTRVSL